MRTIEIAVYNYDELTDGAKDTAFEQWEGKVANFGYSWDDEVANIIKHIESKTPIKCEGLSYDTQSFDYRLGVSGYHGKDDDKYHVTGLRAAKIALAMYYDITHENQFFCRSENKWRGVSFEYHSEKYLNLPVKKRRSAFFKNHECFTGYCDSEVFSLALWDSIRVNTKHDYTVLDHFEVAFDKMFKSVVSDYEALQSREYFEDIEADQYEYTEDGELYTSNETCE